MSELDSDYDTIAAVGVLQKASRFLVIKRSQQVIAPGKFCFPGGRVEEGESVQDTLHREFFEETSLRVKAVREVWVSITSWKCKVHWWLVTPSSPHNMKNVEPKHNELEVESIHWMTIEEMLSNNQLLESNRLFLERINLGEIDLA